MSTWTRVRVAGVTSSTLLVLAVLCAGSADALKLRSKNSLYTDDIDVDAASWHSPVLREKIRDALSINENFIVLDTFNWIDLELTRQFISGNPPGTYEVDQAATWLSKSVYLSFRRVCSLVHLAHILQIRTLSVALIASHPVEANSEPGYDLLKEAVDETAFRFHVGLARLGRFVCGRSDAQKAVFKRIREILAGVGGDINEVNRVEWDPNFGNVLHSAAHSGDEFVVDLLVRHVPCLAINGPGRHGYTALHWAVLNDCSDVIRLLVNTPEVDVNTKSRQEGEETPLALAAKLCRVGAVSELLKSSSILVNEPARVGVVYWTPLQLAALQTWGSCPDVIMMLIRDHRVDIHATGTYHRTALELARQCGLPQCAVLLENTQTIRNMGAPVLCYGSNIAVGNYHQLPPSGGSTSHPSAHFHG